MFKCGSCDGIFAYSPLWSLSTREPLLGFNKTEWRPVGIMFESKQHTSLCLGCTERFVIQLGNVAQGGNLSNTIGEVNFSIGERLLLEQKAESLLPRATLLENTLMGTHEP